MAAARVDLIPQVEGGGGRLEHDPPLLLQAEATHPKLWGYLFISVFLCVCLRLFCGSICQIKIPGVAGFARSTTNQILMSNLELQLLCSKLGSDRDK